MRQHHQQRTTIAILGADTLGEDILARLLREEGYATRHLEASYPTGFVDDEPLDGVDVVLLSPALDAEVREALLEAMRSTPNTAVMPVLTLPAALKLALLDELSASASWRSLFEELVGQIGAALARAATSAGALLVEGCGGGEPAAQADAL